MAKKKKPGAVKRDKKHKAPKKASGKKGGAVTKKPGKLRKKLVTKSAHNTVKAKPKNKKAAAKPARVSAGKAGKAIVSKSRTAPKASLRKKNPLRGKPAPIVKKAVKTVKTIVSRAAKAISGKKTDKTLKLSTAATNGKQHSPAKATVIAAKGGKPNDNAKTTNNPTSQKSASSSAPASKSGAATKNPGKVQLDEKFKSMAANALKRIPPEKRTGVLAINNATAKGKSELTPSKIASISYSITNPARKTDSYAIRPEKEPAGKFEMEFVVHASAEMLYEFISTPSGLSEWFCDDLNIRNGIYTFIWDDQLQQARLLKTVDQQLVRFQWVDKTDGSYFEFRIQRDDLTNDISLIITDFAETSAERESSKLLWHSQVEKLMHVLGSIF